MVILESILTCPQCGHATLEEMPLDSCRFFHECVQCHYPDAPPRLETAVSSAPTAR
jgi:hypothetical protein